MLRTTDAREANDACEALLDQLPEDGPVLVFAHLPPGVVDQIIEDRLAAHDQKVFWICGHLHEHRTIERENLVITTCRGLDPIGSQSHLPELLLVDWDGSEVAVQTHRLPQKMLMHAAEKTGPA